MQGKPPAIVHTGDIAKKMNKATLEGEYIGLGDKTRIYEQNINPNKKKAGGVNDTWHARSIGYTSKDKKGKTIPFKGSVAGAMHPFMDGETMLLTSRVNKEGLAGRTNWTPDEVQAAIWTHKKAMGLMQKRPKLTREEAYRLANETYGESFDRHTVIAKNEPGPKHNQDPWMSEHGNDAIYEATGLYSRPSEPGNARPMVDLETTAAGRQIPANTQDTLNAAERLRGTVAKADVAGWRKPEYKNSPEQGRTFNLAEDFAPEYAGQGRATTKMLAELEKLDPVMQQRISGSPAISQAAQAFALRGPERYDIQNLRETMSQPGWQPRLSAMLKAGGMLPGVVVANELLGSEHR
ncbi:MAG: hypothetical protein EHM35_01200 [Planctomycetaceae bacterium]|nr:MAG: hypothetical protein EHM35_01200 [Planctomycetaceae bacterium]